MTSLGLMSGPIGVIHVGTENPLSGAQLLYGQMKTQINPLK